MHSQEQRETQAFLVPASAGFLHSYISGTSAGGSVVGTQIQVVFSPQLIIKKFTKWSRQFLNCDSLLERFLVVARWQTKTATLLIWICGAQVTCGSDCNESRRLTDQFHVCAVLGCFFFLLNLFLYDLPWMLMVHLPNSQDRECAQVINTVPNSPLLALSRRKKGRGAYMALMWRFWACRLYFMLLVMPVLATVEML